MGTELAIACVKVVVVFALVMQISAFLLWVERNAFARLIYRS